MKSKNNSLTLLMLAMLALALTMASSVLAANIQYPGTTVITFNPPMPSLSGDANPDVTITTTTTSGAPALAIDAGQVTIAYLRDDITLLPVPVGSTGASWVSLNPSGDYPTGGVFSLDVDLDALGFVAGQSGGFRAHYVGAWYDDGDNKHKVINHFASEINLEIAADAVCYEEESAWAANDDIPGDIRYVETGNWATYVEYACVEKTVKFYAGQDMDAGTVHFSACDAGYVTITIDLNEGWYFAYGTFDDAVEGELIYTDESLHIQDYLETPPAENPAPGLFTYKYYAEGESWSGAVPCNDYYGIHAKLLHVVECPE